MGFEALTDALGEALENAIEKRAPLDTNAIDEASTDNGPIKKTKETGDSTYKKSDSSVRCSEPLTHTIDPTTPATSPVSILPNETTELSATADSGCDGIISLTREALWGNISVTQEMVNAIENSEVKAVYQALVNSDRTALTHALSALYAENGYFIPQNASGVRDGFNDSIIIYHGDQIIINRDGWFLERADGESIKIVTSSGGLVEVGDERMSDTGRCGGSQPVCSAPTPLEQVPTKTPAPEPVRVQTPIPTVEPAPTPVEPAPIEDCTHCIFTVNRDSLPIVGQTKTFDQIFVTVTDARGETRIETLADCLQGSPNQAERVFYNLRQDGFTVYENSASVIRPERLTAHSVTYSQDAESPVLRPEPLLGRMNTQWGPIIYDVHTGRVLKGGSFLDDLHDVRMVRQPDGTYRLIQIDPRNSFGRPGYAYGAGGFSHDEMRSRMSGSPYRTPSGPWSHPSPGFSGHPGHPYGGHPGHPMPRPRVMYPHLGGYGTRNLTPWSLEVNAPFDGPGNTAGNVRFRIGR